MQKNGRKKNTEITMLLHGTSVFLFPAFFCISTVPERTIPDELEAPSRLVAEIPNMRGCPGVLNNAVTFFGPASSSLRGRGNYTFSATFNVSRPAKRISEIRVEMTRCRDVVSSNTCEKYGNWRLQTEPCKVWMDPVAPWGGLIKGIEEDYRCPTKSGTYHIRNAVLDMKSLQALNLPLEGAVWQTKAFFLEPSGDLHYCFEGTFIFRRVRA